METANEGKKTHLVNTDSAYVKSEAFPTKLLFDLH